MARRSALVGRPAPGSRAATAGAGGDSAVRSVGGVRSSYRVCASAAGPRRVPRATIRTTRMVRAWGKGQNVPCLDGGVPLRDEGAVDAQALGAAQFRRKVAALEETGEPEPLVGAQRGLVHGARSRLRSLANGESAGSPRGGPVHACVFAAQGGTRCRRPGTRSGAGCPPCRWRRIRPSRADPARSRMVPCGSAPRLRRRSVPRCRRALRSARTGDSQGLRETHRNRPRSRGPRHARRERRQAAASL